MSVYELLLSDGRVVAVSGTSGRNAAMRYVDTNHPEIVRTGVRVVRWRQPAVSRYVPKDERD
jgi:hypothetical protein